MIVQKIFFGQQICAAAFLQNNFQKPGICYIYRLHRLPRSPTEFLPMLWTHCLAIAIPPLSLEIILRLQAARKHIQFLIIKNMNVNASNNPPFSVTFAKIRVPKCRTGSEELISQHVSISCKLLHILISDSRLLVNHGVAHCRLWRSIEKIDLLLVYYLATNVNNLLTKTFSVLDYP